MQDFPTNKDYYVRIATCETVMDAKEGVKPFVNAQLDFNALKGTCISFDYVEGGGYFTALPVSPLDYRKTSKTKAEVHISRNWQPLPHASRSLKQLAGFTRIRIADDRGEVTTIFVGEETWKIHSFSELVNHFQKEELMGTF